MNDVKLRDRRKPGHCWQDNELYDAFGPIIGPNAVLVYVQMTRECWGGETLVNASSRDLAAACGLSRDTVWRALKVMERVGMTRLAAGGCRRTGEYQLVDLKDLAIALGARFDVDRRSYVLPAETIASLRAAVKEVLTKVQRVKNAPPAETPLLASPSVAHSDSLKAPSVAHSDSSRVAIATDLVRGSDRSVAVAGQPTSYYKKEYKNHPPTPRTAGGQSTNDRISALRVQREALEKHSADWWKVSSELQKLLILAASVVETGADPPMTPGRRRRRLTQVQLAARVGM